MLRLFGTATVLLGLVLAAPAADQADSDAKEFAKDLEQLCGSWMSPKTAFAPGITGRFALKLEFKKDSTAGRATVLSFVSKSGVVVKPGPSWTAELKEKDKKRMIVLSELKAGKRVELGEIAYEVNGDKLTLTGSMTLQFERGGNPIELGGEWERKKVDQN